RGHALRVELHREQEILETAPIEWAFRLRVCQRLEHAYGRSDREPLLTGRAGFRRRLAGSIECEGVAAGREGEHDKSQGRNATVPAAPMMCVRHLRSPCDKSVTSRLQS